MSSSYDDAMREQCHRRAISALETASAMRPAGLRMEDAARFAVDAVFAEIANPVMGSPSTPTEGEDAHVDAPLPSAQSPGDLCAVCRHPRSKHDERWNTCLHGSSDGNCICRRFVERPAPASTEGEDETHGA